MSISTSPGFHLPEEILSLVLDHFRVPTAKEIGELRDPDFGRLSEHDCQLKQHLATLSSLNQVSKALNRITRPLLYSIFPGFRVVNARLFVKALARNTELGGHVQQIVIDKWEHVAFTDDHGAHGIDRSYLSLEAQCHQYVRDLRKVSCYPMGLGSPVGSELESGRADVVITMLMALCTNITAIETSVPCLPAEAHRHALLRAQSLWFLLDNMVWRRWSNGSDRRYRSVRELSIRLERQSGAFGVLFSKTMLEMPRLESFSAQRLNCVKLLTPHPMDVHFTHRDPWPGLKRIELRECRIENASLGALLLRAPNLRVLDIQWPVQQHRLHFGIIGEFLTSRGDNLEVVRLDSRQNICPPFEGDTRPSDLARTEAIDAPLGCLHEMENLKHLAATPAALFGCHFDVNHDILKNCLPVSVQELTILEPQQQGNEDAYRDPIPHHDITAFLEHAIEEDLPLRKINIHGSREGWKVFDNQNWSRSAAEVSSHPPFARESSGTVQRTLRLDSILFACLSAKVLLMQDDHLHWTYLGTGIGFIRPIVNTRSKSLYASLKAPSIDLISKSIKIILICAVCLWE
ncbi:uncharacterized protein MYCFIDRAFT_174565 [Pseudocercospora fijiensis CIRAD86]|uniref:Uncharacterized protein n=1 Tax=Pseudocercospora fijiensis (strain CIRAD86) TaxID=383855 RepID=M3B116_PSEFD|nr:uncharacterized protein MYCFIDRAFT_174565 [Pseudocercospora fijiensis CIRAD86]EME83088.1 hypothetical protein MYCFIDRAFT_174565 [Pseudocercospora fijiensis CIRAD86]